MNTGRSLPEIAAELERQKHSRKDYVAPQGKITAAVLDAPDDPVASHGHVVLEGINGPMTLTPYAHSQMATHLGIPKGYYDRMRAEQPKLLAANITTWLKADPDNKRMIRTLDGQVRAVLSPRYRPLDNYDLANAILPVLLEHGVTPMSTELTETRFYIKGILESLSDELPEGMEYGGHQRIGGRHVVAAIVISNSDVGNGTLRLEPSVFTTECTNLMVRTQAAMKKYHIGRAHEADSSWEIYRDDTRKADDFAFWMKVTDVTRAAFNPDLFAAAVAQIRKAQDAPIISDDLAAVVGATVEVLELPTTSSSGLLKHLAAGGNLTQWGLSSAVTRMANDAQDYEFSTVLERAGGRIIDLPSSQWKAIASAVAR